jgi:plastocyanin
VRWGRVRGVRGRAWALAVCGLCLSAGAAAAVAIAAPSHRACPTAHGHRCPRARHARRGHRRHRHTPRKLTQPAGSAGPATPYPSTPSGTSPTSGTPGTPTTPSTTGSGGSTGTSPAPPPGTPAPARVQVTAKEYSFTLSRPEVPAGEVIVEFLNRGEDPHNLHLAEGSDQGPQAGAFPNTAPGVHADLEIEMRPGSYTLFCSLPGHEAKGMKATLTVG